MSDETGAGSRSGDLARFTAVDRAPDARFFVDFIDAGNALPDVRALKPRLMQLLALAPGAHVVDVGCGTGDDAQTLAAAVGPAGRVLDIDEPGDDRRGPGAERRPRRAGGVRVRRRVPAARSGRGLRRLPVRAGADAPRWGPDGRDPGDGRDARRPPRRGAGPTSLRSRSTTRAVMGR